MMGAISKVISDGGGKVTGVIPQFFLGKFITSYSVFVQRRIPSIKT